MIALNVSIVFPWNYLGSPFMGDGGKLPSFLASGIVLVIVLLIVPMGYIVAGTPARLPLG